ncbi:follistatin-related protein 4-like [Osmerus eperlanus]|uniref:follistatin-related protein 4-like n=1 Tax=Osmerus eperlanus TaxID=29151 RepID=UPI002E0FD288
MDQYNKLKTMLLNMQPSYMTHQDQGQNQGQGQKQGQKQGQNQGQNQGQKQGQKQGQNQCQGRQTDMAQRQALVESMFTYLDRNLDGRLGSDELAQISEQDHLVDSMLECTMQDLLRYDDYNNDGLLTLHEFYTAFPFRVPVFPRQGPDNPCYQPGQSRTQTAICCVMKKNSW